MTPGRQWQAIISLLQVTLGRVLGSITHLVSSSREQCAVHTYIYIYLSFYLNNTYLYESQNIHTRGIHMYIYVYTCNHTWCVHMYILSLSLSLTSLFPLAPSLSHSLFLALCLSLFSLTTVPVCKLYRSVYSHRACRLDRWRIKYSFEYYGSKFRRWWFQGSREREVKSILLNFEIVF